MSAFARQNWPTTTHARPVEGRPVILLTIAIVIVATPSRPLRQVMLDYPVNHFDRVPHNWIVSAPNSESHKGEKISTDNIPRRAEAAAVGDMNHGCVRIRVRVWSGGISWIDS